MPTQIDFTIKKDGTGDYTSIKSFVLANQKDLPAADESHFVTIYGDGWDEITPLSESFIDFNNYTTDSTRNITFYVRVEDRHNFTPGTGFVFTISASFGFALRSKHVLFDGFEIANTSNTNNLFDTSANAKLTNCIVHDVDYAQFSGDGEYNIHYNYASRGGFANAFYNGGTLKNIVCIQLITEGGFTGDIGIANANCTNVVLYTDKPTGSFTNFFNCSGDYNAVNKSGEGVPGANSFDTVLVTDFVDFANDNYISKLGGQLESSGEGGTFIGVSLESGSGGNDVSIVSTMPSMTSALSINYIAPTQSTSITSVMPSMQSSIAANYTIPGNSASIVSVMPSMTSSITVTQTAPDYSASISSTMPGMVSAISIANLPPGNNASITSIMPSMASSISINKTNPQYSAQIDSTMPSMVSNINLSVVNPVNNASVESIMPSMTSSLTLTVDEPVSLSLSISSTMPSMTSAISILNGEIQAIQNIDISFANNGISVEYTQSNINISYGE